MEEEDLRLGGLHSHAAGYCDGFGHRQVAAQFILARLAYLPGDREGRLLEVLQIDVDYRLVQDAGVGLLHRLHHLRYCEATHINAACIEQVDIAVGLDSDRLVELGGQRKADQQDILALEDVARMALLEGRPGPGLSRCDPRGPGQKGRARQKRCGDLPRTRRMLRHLLDHLLDHGMLLFVPGSFRFRFVPGLLGC